MTINEIGERSDKQNALECRGLRRTCRGTPTVQIFVLEIKDFITKSTLPQTLREGVTKPTQGRVKQTSNPNRNNTKKQQTTITQAEFVSVY